MIPKSGHRFSEKIMLQQEAEALIPVAERRALTIFAACARSTT
jgi:hypothetical protein